MDSKKLISMARQHQAEQAEALAHLSALDLDGADCIVVCGGQALTFDLSAARRVTSPRIVPPHRAMRFQRAQAEAIAQTIRNGTHACGAVVPVLDAIRADMADRARTLAYLEALEAAATADEAEAVPA